MPRHFRIAPDFLEEVTCPHFVVPTHERMSELSTKLKSVQSPSTGNVGPKVEVRCAPLIAVIVRAPVEHFFGTYFEFDQYVWPDVFFSGTYQGAGAYAKPTANSGLSDGSTGVG